jgi:hypothetical protein
MRDARTAAKVDWLSSGRGGTTETYIAARLRNPAKGAPFTIEGAVARVEYRPRVRVGNCCFGLNVPARRERIQFELEQLRSEAGEMDELISGLAAEINSQHKRLDGVGEEIRHTQQLLRPVRVAAAAILPPELTIADMSIGRLQEKRNQLVRIKSSLGRRDAIATQIMAIQAEIDTLSGTVMEQTSGVDYQRLADRLSDGMNTYLNKLNKAHKDAWVVGEVAFQLGDRFFKIRIGKADWQTKLGGTLTLYFLLAYQYALMDLARLPDSHFPGLLLIDFPAEVEGTTVADKENFVIEPFIDLLAQDGMQKCQLIAAGSSFAGLQGAERVELSQVWKA